MSSSGVESAIADYNELLERGHWQSTHELVSRGMSRREMLPESVGALRPCFMSAARYAAMQQATDLVQRALVALGQRLLVDAALRRRLRITPEDDARVALEVDPREPFSRLDGFIGDDGVIRFMEYNWFPGSAFRIDRAAQSFDETPILAELRKRHRVRYLPTESRVLPSCLRMHELRGGRGTPHIAVVGTPSEGLGEGKADFEWRFILEAALMSGLPIRMVDYEQLEYRHGGLYAGDFRVDCVTYVDHWRDFLTQVPLTSPIWRAVREGAAFFFGSLALRMTRGNKGAFALLSDPEVAAMFAPEVRAAVARHIPWTRMVTEGKTDFHGEPVELLPFVARERERFALKPTDRESAKGVVLGWECDAATWEATLERALVEPHVVQERLQPGRTLYPVVEAGALAWRELNEDCNPYVWNNTDVDGCFIRLSTRGILNMFTGGTLTPLFLVES